MPKIQNLIAIFLVLGVIYAEFLPTLQPTTSLTAYSQADFAPNQSELLLEFFDNDQPEEQPSTFDTSLNADLYEISESFNILLSDIPNNLAIGSNSQTLLPTTPSVPVPPQDQPFIENIIPQIGTPLFEAYTQGGRAWYQEEDKVIVISPDQTTFRSFQVSTGEEINWLQDRLGYDPIDSPNALNNYLINYHGEIVAETEAWAFVKFPSGGFIKIAKPNSQLSRDPFLTQQ